MPAVQHSQLQSLYATGDDPWDFRTSDYEQRKFRATLSALLRASYASALEIGCGNGELARWLAPVCARYTGLDAVEAALTAARTAVPHGAFVQGYLPCILPDGNHDLIVVSEVMYFLDAVGLRATAQQISARWSTAEIIAVNWLGPSGNALQGEDALQAFSQGLAPDCTGELIGRTDSYRIDRFVRS